MRIQYAVEALVFNFLVRCRMSAIAGRLSVANVVACAGSAADKDWLLHVKYHLPVLISELMIDLGRYLNRREDSYCGVSKREVVYPERYYRTSCALCAD